MKKYQELELQVEEIQKEIERLKKEEEENGLPKGFKRNDAMKFLKNRNVTDLSNAFSWKSTPQGLSYWSDVYMDLKEDNGNLDDQDIIQIQKWIIQSYQEQYGV